MTTLTGKVAVVTGASKGIGAAIAKLFAKSGASVVVHYSSGKAAADALVAEIKNFGGEALAIQADFSKTADLKRLFAQTKSAFGALDVVVNNAGVYAFDPLEAATEQEFHREFTTNVLGVIIATQESAKHFGPNGGSIINISSIVSVGYMPNSVIYAASKSAVDAITRVTRTEEDPCQQHRPGRHPHRGHRGARLAGRGSPGDGRVDPIRSTRPAGRHCARGTVPRIR
jgi:3-oxoacyl-[acyl-carrier protein] reductase